MFTVSMRRTLFVLSIVAPLTVSQVASAQGAVIIRTDGANVIGSSANSILTRILPFSDDTLRSLIERYEPGVLTDDAEANIVTIVLDNAGNYVSSTSRHARVIQAETARVISLGTDSVRALVLPRAVDGEIRTMTGGGVAVTTLRRADALGEPRTIMGTGYTADEVEAIATKRFAAGTLSKSQLIVTVVRLK